MVQGVELDADLRRDQDPVPGAEGVGLGVPAGQTQELDVRFAAGHDEPPRREHALPIPAQLGDLALELHGLAVVFLGLLGDVPVPEGVVVVLDHNGISFNVEGQGVLDVVEGGAAVSEVVNDVDAAADGPGQLVQGHDVVALLHPVEDHHLRAGELVHHELTHIGVVAQYGLAVGEHDLLGDDPLHGHLVEEVRRGQHAVELHHHAGGVVLFLQGLQLLGGHGLLVDGLKVHALVGVGGGVVLLLALLAHQQQGTLAGVEARVLQGLLDEQGLARFQKPGEGIDGNGHGVLLTGRRARPAPLP